MARDTRSGRSPPPAETIADALRDVVAAEAIETADLEARAIDGLVPSVVVRPSSAAQVAAVLAACAELGVAVVPRGGGTKLALGGLPWAADVVLETGGLDQIEAYNPGDLTLGVQAGMPLAALQQRLGAERQFLPLDPPFAERATIGGVLATNGAGPRRVLNGTLRDLVIGAEVAGVDGRVTKSGGMVVKNVTGYDLHKAHIGALGTLGIVTRVNLKVAPLPAAERTAVYGFVEPSLAGMAVGRIVEASVTPSGVDLIDRRLVVGSVQIDAPWLLAVRISGTAAGVDAQHDIVAAAVGPKVGRGADLTDEAQAAFWRAAVAVAEPPEQAEPYAVCRISALSSQIPSLLGSALEAARSAGLEARAAAQAVNGVARVRFTGATEAGSLCAAITELRRAARHLDASVVVEAAPPDVKRGVDVWGLRSDGATLELMRALRRSFDPRQILNPGRFVGEAA